MSVYYVRDVWASAAESLGRDVGCWSVDFTEPAPACLAIGSTLLCVGSHSELRRSPSGELIDVAVEV